MADGKWYIVHAYSNFEKKVASTIREQAEMQQRFDSYVKETAGSAPADQLHKLSDLKQRGDLSEAEFEQAKAKLLA